MSDVINGQTIYGSKACIVIQSDATLEQLAYKLAGALNLKEFTIDSNDEPPHQRIASAETMGWEMWLTEDASSPPHTFRLRIETEHSLKESFEGRMYDLSPWFARLISTLCDVKAEPVASS